VDTTTAYLSLMPQLQGMKRSVFKQVIRDYLRLQDALRAGWQGGAWSSSYGVRKLRMHLSAAITGVTSINAATHGDKGEFGLDRHTISAYGTGCSLNPLAWLPWVGDPGWWEQTTSGRALLGGPSNSAVAENAFSP